MGTLEQQYALALSDEQAEDAWPAELHNVFARFMTAEYGSLTRQGRPVTYPIAPYVDSAGGTLDFSTGLAYPAKAERARRTPRVALLFSDPTGSGLDRPPVVLVQGLARVRDADLQANTDRYLRWSQAKTPDAYRMMPAALLRRIAWYLARIWVEVTPTRLWWWPEGRLDQQPQQWAALPGRSAPPSDPAPSGPALAAWKPGPSDWRAGMAYAIQQLGSPVVTMRDHDGYPLPLRTRRAQMQGDAVAIELPAGAPAFADGPACLTFHHHPEIFTGQQHMVFTGQISQAGAGAVVTVERQLGDWSLGTTPLQTIWSFLRHGRVLARRVEAEARRRGQPVPSVRLPSEP